jgi:serine protease Do
MKLVRNTVAGVVLGIAMTVAWFVGSGLVKNVEFARAQERVEATRAQIANVQDMAAVFKAVGKAVEPSVVNIDVKKTVPVNTRQFFGRLRDRLNPQDENNDNGQMPDGVLPFSIPDELQQVGTGSGVIIEAEGDTAFVVTNNHVASNATEMEITLWDGRIIKNAKLIGTDPKSDMAVIKIQADRLIPAKWGDSSSLEKGDIIMAFGSPFGYVGSMTHGIVSAINRDRVGIIHGDFAYENFIQVDAPINPGNSGGPLVNLKGEVVGINTAIASESGGFQGIGFAIPSNQAKFVYEAIKSKGKVVRGWLGVGIADVSDASDLATHLGYADHTGVVVERIYRDTPAYGKLEVNDIITAVNGKKVDNTQQLRSAIASTPPDTEVKLAVFRNKKQQDVALKVGEQPEAIGAIASAGQQGSSRSGRNSSGQVTADSLGVRLASPNADLAQRYGLEDGVKGAVVTAVRAGSVASRAGLQAGDVITKIDDSPVSSADDVTQLLGKKDLSAGVTMYVANRDSMRSVFIKTTAEK